MGGGLDSRGVSEVLGSILVFSILIALLALFQVTVVPDQNEEAEFKHNERVQQDMMELQGAISQVAATGASGTVSVKTGMRYPSRLLLLNPGPVSGTIRTESVAGGDIHLDNFTATNEETADYLDGSNKSFETHHLVYDPSYNLYDNAPETTYLSTVLYNDFEDGVTIRDKGSLVSGNRISLILLDGELSGSSVSATSVSPQPLSAPARTVGVVDSGSNPVITIDTKLSANVWENKILDDEMSNNPNDGKHIIDIRCPGAGPSQPCNGPLKIELKSDVAYKLRMAKIGVGSRFTDEGAHYLTTIGSGLQTVTQNQQTEVGVEVRDRFNAPVANENVTFRDADAGTNIDTISTDVEGRATLSITPAADTTLHAFFGRYDPTASDDVSDPDKPPCDESRKCVVFDIDTVPPRVFGAIINPASSDSVVLNDARIITTTGTGDETVEIDLENLDTENKDVDELRVSFFGSTAPGRAGMGTPISGPSSVTISDTNGNSNGPLTIGADFQPVTLATLEAGGPEETYTFEFDEEVFEGDFFIVSVIYVTPSGEKTSATYFVGPDA